MYEMNVEEKEERRAKLRLTTRILYIVDLLAYGVGYYVSLIEEDVNERKSKVLKLVKIVLILMPLGLLILYKELRR